MTQRKKRIKHLEEKLKDPNLWAQPEGKKLTQELNDLKEKVLTYEKLKREISDLLEIALLDKEDKEVNLREEIEKEVGILKKNLSRFELNLFLSGIYDSRNAIVSIYAGAGGTDAQDWAEMLLRMYLRFCEKKGWQTKIVDESRGGEAGIKSVTLFVSGSYAYGYLRGEKGVHRLVRISPFDAEKMRHTSFALVEVLPEIESPEIEIKPEDLEIKTFLASGRGGQYVQKTETAIRIKHLPTGITVTCQSERSQYQNKKQALKILAAKLKRYFEAKKEEEREALRGKFTPASWGNQIRSYVLHPYKLIKDHRTGYETKEAEKILDGDLDEVIEAYLKSKK